MKILLEDVYKKIVTFLNKEKSGYIIIGGMAAGILGEPRLTGDIDIDIILDKEKLSTFLIKARKAGFKVDEKKCARQVKEAGVFQIGYGDFHIDFIIVSTDLEMEAIRRKKTIKLYGIKASFPTPEDFILLKIVPRRPQDLVDAKKVVIRHKGKLDLKYLKKWAQILSEEAEDMRIYNELEKLLARRV